MIPSWETAYYLEATTSEIFRRQEVAGWFFDTPEAEKLYAWVIDEMDRIYDEVRPHLRYQVEQPYPAPVKKITKAGGQLTSTVVRWFSQGGELDVPDVGGPFTRVHFTEPNLASPLKLHAQLYHLGWEPDDWNIKTGPNKQKMKDPETGEFIRSSPKVTESSLESLTTPIGAKVARWLKLKNRRGTLAGMLKNVREDSTIPSVVISPATPTARVVHRVVTNIPKAKKSILLGHELRALFRARPGRVIVGSDQAQIDARMIAHLSIVVTGKTALADKILGRDFHAAMWEALGGESGLCSDRDATKTVEYAFLYGAGAETLGKSCDQAPDGWSNAKTGDKVLELLGANMPGVVETRKAAATAAKRGWIVGLTGRPFYIRKPHAALNTYAQGCASEACKYWMCSAMSTVTARGLDVLQVGFYHDETQSDVAPEDVEEYSQILKEAAGHTQKALGVRVPMEADVKVGETWADTH